MFQVGYFLLRNAETFSDRTAVIFKEKEITYSVLNQKVNRLANHMTAMGIKKGDRLAYMFPNSLELIYIWYATQKIGATAVPLNTRLLADEIKRTLEYASCKAFFYHEKYEEKVNKIETQLSAISVIKCEAVKDEGTYFDKLCAEDSDKEAQISMEGSDESILLFTSGTTGVSKGVVRSQQVVRDYALMMALENDNSHKPEVLLTHCPLFHTAGMSLVMKMAALAGTLILMDKVDCEEILKQIEKYRATQILVIPPTLYMKFTDVADWQKYDLSSIKEAQCSGGKCTMDHAKKIFEIFPNCSIKVSWGSTETCAPTSTVLSKEQLLEKPKRIHTIGKLNALVELRLVDEEGEDVADGQVGEAIVRSSMVFNGYLGQPELSKKSFRDGWFYTEDMLKKDEDGYYYLVDRKRDIIKTGGENVYAQEVEAVLCEHEAIYDCAVIGVVDQYFGEAVAAAIVLKKDRQLTLEEISEFCKERMPSYKKPRHVAFIDELPRNSTGKLQKSVLRENSKSLFGVDAYQCQ